MSKTRHIQKRMSQRGIKQSMIDLVLDYGMSQGDKIILNRKGIDKILIEIAKLKKEALKIRDKGGLVVVEDGGSLITCYSLNSYGR